MKPQVIDIPNVGPVEFPASMSQDEVNAAAKRLYDEANKEPVTERESPELFGSAGAGLGAVGAVGDVIYSKGRPLIRAGEKLMGMEPSGPPKVKPRTFQDPSTVAQGAIERRTAADLPEGTTTTVRNWTAGKPGAGTGQQAGEFLGGANYSEADKFAKERLAFETANPTMKVQPGSRLAIPEQDAEVIAKQRAALQAQANATNQAEVNAVAQTRADRLQERNTLKDQANRKNMLVGSANVVGRGVLPILGGYEAGAQGAQAYNRLTRPDLTASDAAAGAANVVGSAAGMRSMFPGRARIPAAILSQGASAIANFLDKRNPRNEPEEQTAPGMAMGGSVAPNPKLKSLSDFLDQLMQQATAPAPAPAPAAPQGGMPPGMPPQGGMPPGMPGVPPQQPPMQQPPTQQSPLNAMMSQMAAGGKVGGGLELAKKAIKRASEALGSHEGKRLYTTQSDRMRSTDGDLGGPGFSKFQLERPEYKDAAWGVGKPGTATAITNVNKREPEGNAIWVPMIGSETQHQSNQHVYDRLTDEFNRQVSMGKLPKELREKMNTRLQTYPEYAGLFKGGLDVANPEMLQKFGDTFERRGALSSVLGGKGIGGTKAQIFDYPGIMQEMTDPLTIGAPTHSVGTRLFTLNNQVDYRPDLHGAFPYILRGQDLGVEFAPVPKELAIPDWLNLVREFKGREPGYMDYTRGLKGSGTPNQLITEKMLRAMEDAGYKKGGLV
jgi:hypothetical protein